MAIKQLTVFIQNKQGSVVSVTDILSKNNINLRARSIAETQDFGILRLIVNDPDKACEVLRAQHFIVKQNDVLAAVIDDRPGGLTAVLDILAAVNVSVEYMYAFVGSKDGHAVVVIRPDNAEAAIAALEENHISTLDPKDVYRL